MDVRRCHAVSRPVTVTCDAGAVLVLTLCGLVASLGPGTSLSSVRTSWVSSDSCSLYNRVRCCTLDTVQLPCVCCVSLVCCVMCCV